MSKRGIPHVFRVSTSTTYDTCQQNNRKDVPDLFGVHDYRLSSLSESRNYSLPISSPYSFLFDIFDHKIEQIVTDLS